MQFFTKQVTKQTHHYSFVSVFGIVKSFMYNSSNCLDLTSQSNNNYQALLRQMEQKSISEIKRSNMMKWIYSFRFQICKVMAILSTIYLLLALFEIKVLIAFAVLITSILGFVYLKWRLVRQKGIINYVSPKTRQILLKRSISDIYRDLIYFPYATKIIKVLLSPAITKPHPDQLDKMFQKLPEKIKNTMFTKGILHLAPAKVQRLVLEKQPSLIQQLETAPQQNKNNQIVLSKSYGTVNPLWDRRLEYEAEDVKVHEHTISKQFIIRISEKLKWVHIIALATFLVYLVKKTNGKKLKKIFVYNSSVLGIIALAALILIKYKEPLRSYKEKLQKIGK